jgi:hypothetical protein
MTSVAVITSIYGTPPYDDLKIPTTQNVDCRWICVTETDPGPTGPWEVVLEPRAQAHPRLAAKFAKCLPWRYAPEADVTIWIDGSATVIHPDFVQMCLDTLADHPMAQWRHPERHCIYTEGDASIAYGKYADQNVAGQVRHYSSKGYPAGAGLWATGCIVRRHDPLHDLFGAVWLGEQLRWTIQDQISEPVVMKTIGLYPAAMPEELWSNRWLAFGGHRG